MRLPEKPSLISGPPTAVGIGVKASSTPRFASSCLSQPCWMMMPVRPL